MLCVLFIFLLCFSFVPCISTSLICSRETVSCSNQLWENEKEDTCRVILLGLNNTVCQNKLDETPSRNLPDRGIIKIEPFEKSSERRTIFRITAYNITWNNWKIRFFQQNSANCMSREFLIQKLVTSDKILTYDCPWATSRFEDKIIDFEYTYGVNNIYDGKRTFLIHVPLYETISKYNTSDLSNLELFTYVETTDLYRLIYKIHIAPQHVNVTFYEIFVNYTRNNVSNIDGPHVRDAKNAILGVIDFEYYTLGIPGEYVFEVRPHDCKQCNFSKSVVVTIPESSTIITIGIVGLSCLIPFFLITLYKYSKVESGLTPRVLLITSPANNAHKTVGKSLANLLTQKYNIPTMIDIIDIPKSKEPPAEWLKRAFNRATHVLILMSDNRPATIIYRNIDNLVFSLLQSKPNKICCTITFPFTEQTDLYKDFHRNFYFMKDYNKFINFLHNRGFLRRLMYKVIRNDLDNDLRKQINNYKNGVAIPFMNNCDEEKNQNERNDRKTRIHQEEEKCLKDDEDNLKDLKTKIVIDMLNNIDQTKLNMDEDNSDTQSINSDVQSINSAVQMSLEEVSPA